MATPSQRMPPPRLWRIPRVRYEAMVRKGAFDEARVRPRLSRARGHFDYLDAHPTAPVLVLEVAMTSLAKDRLRKGGLYARAGIADYGIVNLVDEVLEVYREPTRAPSRRYGSKYATVRLLKRGARVSPLAAPRARTRVADLLP